MTSLFLMSHAHQAREEHDYVQWLKGGGVELAKEVSADLAPLKEYWGNTSLSADEQFLRDYILDKKYLEPDMSRYSIRLSSGREGGRGCAS